MIDKSKGANIPQRSMMMTIIAGVAIAATLVGLAGCSSSAPGSAETTLTSGPTASAASGQQPTVSHTLPGRAYNVVYDPYRNAIWYVVMAATPPATMPESPVSPYPAGGSASTQPQLDAILYETSPSSGLVIADFSIPNPDGDTGASDVVGIAPDQSVWVAESYHLYRIAPSTSAVQSLALSQNVRGSVSTPNQGTFVTAMTFTSGSVLIGRNNVPFLEQWSLSLQPLADLALPSGDYGPSYLTTTSSGIQMMAFSTSDPTSLTGQQASIPLPTGTESPTAPSGAQLQPQYLVVRPDHVTANLQGLDGSKILTVAGSSPQTLTWQPSSGPAIQIAWPKTTGQITNPMGEQVPTQSWPQLEASVVLPNDTLWIIVTTPAGPTLQLYTTN